MDVGYPAPAPAVPQGRRAGLQVPDERQGDAAPAHGRGPAPGHPQGRKGGGAQGLPGAEVRRQRPQVPGVPRGAREPCQAALRAREVREPEQFAAPVRAPHQGALREADRGPAGRGGLLPELRAVVAGLGAAARRLCAARMRPRTQRGPRGLDAGAPARGRRAALGRAARRPGAPPGPPRGGRGLRRRRGAAVAAGARRRAAV
mmetsp:Transcript_10166/g.32035  ORF Transcript_10166/g.32035 Transcript_10166/m.32035 type:complete len:203 (+) Transcript_10166:1057-1665(+)